MFGGGPARGQEELGGSARAEGGESCRLPLLFLGAVGAIDTDYDSEALAAMYKCLDHGAIGTAHLTGVIGGVAVLAHHAVTGAE